MASPTDLPARLECLELLTEGPVECTWKAHDQVLQRDVMVKLPGHGASAAWSAPVRQRILREARAMAKIRHEGVAPIYWVEETADGPLLVLDLPEGELLTERLLRGPLDVAETIELGIAVGEALAHVHYHGIVHRCVGPTSIRLLPSGRVQLGSFTFAKEFGSRHQISSLAHAKRDEAPIALCLPDYSAPEQSAGQAADPRADIYALGCTLFRCLAGREAFEPGHEHEPMPDLRKLHKGVSKALAEVIRKCALPSKTARFATAQQVVDALKASRTDASKAGGSRRAGLIGITSVACLALLAVFGRDLWSSGPEYRGPDSGSEARAPEHEGYQKKYGGTYGHVYGLFIGIGEGYAGTDLPVLTNPRKEITKVSDQLRQNDSQWAVDGAIKVLPEAESTDEGIIKELVELAAKAQPEDAVLIYFAGHATKDGDSFGLCATNVKGSIATGNGYLRREVLSTHIGNIKAKHVLTILDCCHSGAVFAFEPSYRGAGRNPDFGMDAVSGAHHRQSFSREFICSSTADQKASDGTDLSPFCRLLLTQLSTPASAKQDYVVARFLSSDIAQKMDAASGNIQMPAFRQMSRQEGSFVFRLAKPK